MSNPTYIASRTVKLHSAAMVHCEAQDEAFTLIEMMMVVAMIAILAAIAFAAYSKHLRNGRVIAGRELVSRIQAREETYFQNFGQYCRVNTADSEPFYPALGSQGGGEPTPKTWTAIPAAWQTLGARPESDTSYFSFLVVASNPTAVPAHPLDATAGTLGIPPQPADPRLAPHPWYYVIAHADLNGKGTTYASGRCASGILSDTKCTILAASSARTTIAGWNEGE